MHVVAGTIGKTTLDLREFITHLICQKQCLTTFHEFDHIPSQVTLAWNYSGLNESITSIYNLDVLN